MPVDRLITVVHLILADHLIQVVLLHQAERKQVVLQPVVHLPGAAQQAELRVLAALAEVLQVVAAYSIPLSYISA